MKWLYDKYIAIFVDALVEEIKSTGIIKSTLKSSRIQGSGWGRIPNIRDIRVNLGSYNKVLQLLGIHVREGTMLKFDPLKPDRMNRFMSYQLWKLSSYREKDPDKFFKLAFALMRRSTAFRVSAINHVFFNWYKKYPLWWILRTNRRANKILATGDTLLDFSRVYIPKPGSDKVRPLGVPSPEWRLVLHMANNFFHWYLRDFVLTSQHGFIPGRGSLSAWKEMFSEGLLDKPFIYECDLKQFFPSVKLWSINQALLGQGVPKWVVDWIDKINSRLPKLPQEVLLESDKEKEKSDWDNAISSVIQDLKPLHLKPLRDSRPADLFYEHPRDEKWEIGQTRWLWFDGKPYPFTITGKLTPLKKKVPEYLDPANPDYLSRTGVPQGAPTSPFLSILTLKNFLSQQRSVSYADDPVFFGDKDFHIRDSPDEGIVIHPEKSGWVKRDGVWLKPLKFLGLEFDGETLRANTRNGSRLVLNGDVRKALHFINQLEHEMYKDVSKKSGFISSKERVLDNWYNLFKSRLIGHITSRLYIGSWNQSDIVQDFLLKFVSTSWLDLKWKSLTRHKWYTIFNASSYASWSLAEILRHRYRKDRNKG